MNMPTTKKKVASVLEFINPDMARVYLERMRNNRTLSQRIVNQYARDMTAKRWISGTPQGIAFDAEGFLIDGQHRLQAIVKSGMTIQMLVIRNCSNESMLVMDSGKKRSAYQSAVIAGKDYISLEGIAVARSMLYDPSVTVIQAVALSNLEQIELYEKHREAIDFSLVTHQVFKSRFIRSSGIRSIVARAFYTKDKERLAQFLYCLDTGLSAIGDIDADSGAIVLRNMYLEGCAGKENHWSSNKGSAYLIRLSIRAVDKFLRQERVRVLKESLTQLFPVTGLDDVPLYAKMHRS